MYVGLKKFILGCEDGNHCVISLKPFPEKDKSNLKHNIE